MTTRAPKKYAKGDVVKTLDEVRAHSRQGRYMWWNDKPYHTSFIASWSFHMVAQLVEAGQLFSAAETAEWRAWRGAAVFDCNGKAA